jgi:hypothetical protein
MRGHAVAALARSPLRQKARPTRAARAIITRASQGMPTATGTTSSQAPLARRAPDPDQRGSERGQQRYRHHHQQEREHEQTAVGEWSQGDHACRYQTAKTSRAASRPGGAAGLQSADEPAQHRWLSMPRLWARQPLPGSVGPGSVRPPWSPSSRVQPGPELVMVSRPAA